MRYNGGVFLQATDPSIMDNKHVASPDDEQRTYTLGTHTTGFETPASANHLHLDEVTCVCPPSADPLRTHPARLPSSIPRSRRFGEYELIAEIARGGMGVVYRARQVRAGRTVALKMILSGQLASDDDVRRFYAEAQAAAGLDHPGIVPIYEVGEIGGQHYYSMALVEGRSLADRIEQGSLPPREAAELVRKIARAVAYAHRCGVIHRDLKPANVLLDKHGEPRITDFGLAKRGGEEGLTATGQILGTPSYMPPEQAAGQVHDVCEGSDVYALGAILFATLTGRPPFQSRNPLDTLVQVLEGEVTLPTRLNRQVPRPLELICLRCLEKKPNDRYESANALADDLDRFLRDEPVEARPADWPQRLRRWARRSPALAGHWAAISAALLIVQVKFLFKPTDVVYHMQHTGALLLWAFICWVLQRFLNHARTAECARYVWAGVDPLLFTFILYLAMPPLGPLTIGYAVMIAVSGLMFRVRLVATTTIASIAAYAILLWARPEEAAALHYNLIFIVLLMVLGGAIAYQVKRIRVLSQYYECR